MFDSFLDAINARGPDRPGLVRDVRGCVQSGNLDAQPTHLAKPTNSAAATTRTQVRTSVFSGIFQTPQNSASVRRALTRGQLRPASVAGYGNELYLLPHRYPPGISGRSQRIGIRFRPESRVTRSEERR